MGALDVLDAKHMRDQRSNASDVVRLIFSLWLEIMDADNVAATAGSWLDAVIEEIVDGQRRAQQIATNYTYTVRELVAPSAPAFTAPPMPPPNVDQIRRSLAVTGPTQLQALIRRTPDVMPLPPLATPDDVDRYERTVITREERVKEALNQSGAAAGRSAFKLTVNGARDATDLIIARDRTAVGYARITREKPCGWCLMLAGRGPVYKADSFKASDARFTGPGNHKVHDGCGCTLRPLYSRSEDNWTETARTSDKLWVDLSEKTGKSGKALVNEFRNEAKRLGLGDLTRW